MEELTTPLETWLYFLRYGEILDPEALPGTLDRGEIRQAMEALTMLSEIDLQREIYEGRLKRRRDEQMVRKELEARRTRGLAEAREKALAEGRAEGQTQGSLIGRIELAQRLLRREPTPREELEAMALEALGTMAEQLEREVTRLISGS